MVRVHTGAVWDDKNVVRRRHGGNAAGLGDPTNPRDVWLQDVNTAALDQLSKAIANSENHKNYRSQLSVCVCNNIMNIVF